MPALQKLPRMPARQGPGKEKLSLLQEAEQLLIKDSVRIDVDAKQAIAYLAFTADPKEHIHNNYLINKKRLESICKKYGTNTEVCLCSSIFCTTNERLCFINLTYPSPAPRPGTAW